MIKFKNLSIKQLTLFIIICMYIIFFICTSFSLHSYSNYEYTKTNDIIKQFNTSVNKQISDKLSNISDTTKYPLLIPDVDTLHSTLLSQDIYTLDGYNYLYYLCDMMLIQNDIITGAFIYNLNGDGVYNTRNIPNGTFKNVQGESWFNELLNSTEQTKYISDISYNNLLNNFSINSNELIAIARKLIDMNTQAVTGVILVTIPKEDLLNLIDHNLPYEDAASFLYDNNGNLIYSSNPDINLKLTDKELSSNSLQPTLETSAYNSEYIVAYSNISNCNWLLLNYVAKDTAYNLNSLYIFNFAISIAVFSILFIIMYLFLLTRVFKPINSLITHMSFNLEQSLEYNLTYNKDDEIGFLIKTYNTMKNRINNLININYKNKIEQKDLELQQLQIQINPHFIYNTLESIHMMAEINDDYETSIMAQQFGSIIRYSMNRKINTVTLKEELDIINNYIYLQRIRFDQLFTIENLITDEYLKCEIIKMIIQPLIENSINHGLSKCSSDGKIIIQSHKIDKTLLITVSDNGIGIDSETLNDLNDYINDKNNKFKGIALRNVHRRLKLKYGEEYGLTIHSVEGKETSVVLKLPYKII